MHKNDQINFNNMFSKQQAATSTVSTLQETIAHRHTPIHTHIHPYTHIHTHPHPHTQPHAGTGDCECTQTIWFRKSSETKVSICKNVPSTRFILLFSKKISTKLIFEEMPHRQMQILLEIHWHRSRWDRLLLAWKVIVMVSFEPKQSLMKLSSGRVVGCLVDMWFWYSRLLLKLIVVLNSRILIFSNLCLRLDRNELFSQRFCHRVSTSAGRGMTFRSWNCDKPPKQTMWLHFQLDAHSCRVNSLLFLAQFPNGRITIRICITSELVKTVRTLLCCVRWSCLNFGSIVICRNLWWEMRLVRVALWPR